jgi:hypothetical protein
LLSPLQLKLSTFLNCLYDSYQLSTEINNSFHRNFKSQDKKVFDYTVKSTQKGLINIIASNELLRLRILDSLPPNNSVNITKNFDNSFTEELNNSFKQNEK